MVIFRHALVLIVLLFTASASRAQTGGDALNLRRLEQAVGAIGDGNLSRAEALLGSVLASAPRDADALNLLGVVRAQQRREPEAERLFRRALAAQPAHVGAHVNLGELFITTGRAQEALDVLLAADKLAPHRPDINLSLAAIYSGRGEHERALEHLRLVPSSATGGDYFTLLLKSLLALKRNDDARRLAREFGDAGSDARAHAEFALLLARGGLTDEALALLETARAREPRAFDILYALGFISAATGRYEQAETHLAEALRAKPDDVATLRALASVARATGNLEKSLAQLVHARRVAPASPGVLYDFGVTTLQMGLLLDALPVFEELHRAHPREPAYLYGLAAARLKKGEKAEAVRLLKDYIALRPKDAAGFYLLGVALDRLEQYAAARAALEQSLRLKPGDADAEYLLGETLGKEGDRAAAVEMFRRVVRARPDHAPAHAALGAAYREQGDYTEAKAALERAVELDPEDLRASYQLGLVYAKLGDREGAKKMFDRADVLRGRERQRETVILKLIDPPQN